MKKYRKSPFTIASYVCSGLFGVYMIYQIVVTLKSVAEYYQAYEATPKVGEVLGYIIQTGIAPLVYMLIAFMLGYILNEVRKQNPAYYRTDEEIAKIKEAKKQAKAEIKAAKEKAQATINEMNEKAEDAVEEIQEKTEDAVEEFNDKAEKAVDEFNDKVADKIDDVGEKMEEKVSEVEELKEVVKEKKARKRSKK